MKAPLFLLMLFVLTVAAQPPPEPQNKPPSPPPALAGGIELRTEGRGAAVQAQQRRRTSGVAAQAVRVRNPLRLIDPRAPRELGDGNDNVSRDPVTGQAQGIRVFTISF